MHIRLPHSAGVTDYEMNAAGRLEEAFILADRTHPLKEPDLAKSRIQVFG